MTLILSGELSQLKAVQVTSLHDAGQILQFSSTTNALNLPVKGYVAQAEIACGYRPSSGREVHGESQIVLYDATLRVPLGTVISTKDRFRLTRRFGSAVSPTIDFEIIGSGQRAGITAGRYLLRTITNERQS